MLINPTQTHQRRQPAQRPRGPLPEPRPRHRALPAGLRGGGGAEGQGAPEEAGGGAGGGSGGAEEAGVVLFVMRRPHVTIPYFFWKDKYYS